MGEVSGLPVRIVEPGENISGTPVRIVGGTGRVSGQPVRIVEAGQPGQPVRIVDGTGRVSGRPVRIVAGSLPGDESSGASESSSSASASSSSSSSSASSSSSSSAASSSSSSSEALPATEIVRPNGSSGGSAAVNAATRHAALNDQSDGTWVAVDFEDSKTPGYFYSSVSGITYGDLQSHGGRNIASFTGFLRVGRSVAGSTSGTNWFLNTITGITVTPSGLSSSNFALSGTTPEDKPLSGSFTKSGGGVWTPDQFNTLIASFVTNYFSGTTNTTHRVYEHWVEVTYE